MVFNFLTANEKHENDKISNECIVPAMLSVTLKPHAVLQYH